MEKQSTRKFLKLFVALVALFLLGSSALLLSSCKEEHTHDWGEGTVTVQPTCTAQGLKTFECSCGQVRTEPIQATGHTWVKEGEPVAPTCSMEGYTLYKCSVCGETEQRDVKPTVAHKFEDVEEDCIEPTCTTPGLTVKQCVYCGTYDRAEIPATGHTWDDGETVEATCQHGGYTLYTCTKCGETENKNSTPAVGHKYDKENPYLVVPANCIAQGYTQYRCEWCGEIWTDPSSYTEKTKHDYEVIEVAATCTTDGYDIHECSFCGDRYIDDKVSRPALGHDYEANNDTADKLYGAVVKLDTHQVLADVKQGETLTIGKHQYANVAAAKADGWTTVTAPTCETAGKFQRVCTRCTQPETVNVAATGHYKTAGQVCVINNNLVDFEGNRDYAFECRNGNCNIDVVIDNVGNTAHYIKVVDHTYELKASESYAATCQATGMNVYYCKVCNDRVEKVLPQSDHHFNTVRLDGKTPVVACEADPALVGEDAEANYMAYMREQLGDKQFAASFTDLSDYFASVSSKQIAAICSDCGAIKEATGHNFVVGILEEGKFAESDYMKNEDGTPVVAEGVTSETMTCRNVLVCSNAGCIKTNGTGPHGEHTFATCREEGKCNICGEPYPGEAQYSHNYLQLTKITAAWANSETKVNNTEYSQKQVYAAYQAVKSDVPFMNVVAATCTTDGTDAFVCVTCLMDAYNGMNVDWTKISTVEDADDVPQSNAFNYSAYTMVTTAGHEYSEVKYFRLNATDTSSPIVFEQTNCEFGFKTALFCKNCGDLYVNEIVIDDDKTTDVDESKANTASTYTDKDGFILDVSQIADIDNELTATEAAKAVVEDNRGAHSLFVYDEYYTSNGYVAPTCVSNAVIPYHCVHCGAIIVITYGATDADRYEVNSKTNLTVRGETYKNEVRTNDQTIDVDNHAGDTYACGTHCKAQENGKYICGAFGVDYDGDVAEGVEAIGTEDADHATVTVNYLFSTSVEYYDDTYELKLVDVEADDIDDETNAIDWKTLTYRDADTASACEKNTTAGGDGGSTTNNYKLPQAFNPDAPAAGKYFVLVNGDKYYPLEDGQFSIWTDDDTTVGAGNEISGDVTVTQNDTFFVRLDSTALKIPVDAVNQASLEIALKATPETVGNKKVLTVDVAKNITLAEDSSLATYFTRTDGVELVVNLNGNTLTQSANAQFAPTENVTFNNGTLNFTTTAKDDAASLINPTGDVVFTLNNVTLKAASGSGVYAEDKVVDSNWVVPEIVIKGSTIEVPGYAVSTNAGRQVTTSEEALKITIENSTLKSTKATGLFVNVLSDVKVSDSTIIGLQQAVMVRGGTVTITNSTLTLLKDTPVTVSADNYATDVTVSGATTDLAYGDFAKGAFLEGFTKVEDYRIAGIWGEGNAAPRAVLTIGNVQDDAAAYQYATNVNIATNVTLDNQDDAVPTIVVGSVYSAAFVEGLEDAAAVSLSCSAQDAAEVVLCWNSDAKDANNASLASKIAAVAVNGTTINK